MGAKKIEGGGSGITTRSIAAELQQKVARGYEDELKALGPRCKPKTRGDLVAGFKDGMRVMLQNLVGMGIIVIVEEPKKEEG